ncbi:MAG: yhhT [Variovorax sp.]|nr:yhhT [Variovorax sp.]
MKPETARTAATLTLFALCAWLLHRLLVPVAWAALLAVSTWPVHERLRRRVDSHRSALVSAGLLTLATVVVIVLPMVYLVLQAVREAPAAARLWAHSQESGLPAPDWIGALPWVGPWLLAQWNTSIADPGALAELARSLGASLGFDTGRTLLADAGHGAMSVFFCVLVLFFLYLQGDALSEQIERMLLRQFGTSGTDTLRTGVVAVRGTVNGLVLVGLGVGVLMGGAYAIARIPHPAFWGLCTALLGMVPFGAMLVVLGCTLYLFTLGASTAALVLGLFGAFLIFTADHFVRPAFIAGSSRLPVVLALLGVFGGLETLGVIGIFLGPTLMAVLATVWRALSGPRATH